MRSIVDLLFSLLSGMFSKEVEHKIIETIHQQAR